MSDNKNIRDGRDRSEIDVNDPSEVEAVHHFFPQFTHQQIIDAIKEKGPSRDEVMNYLKITADNNNNKPY